MFFEIDVSENSLVERSPKLLDLLLTDRTTDGNIIWATDHYTHLGDGYAPEAEIRSGSITGSKSDLIQPRVKKVRELQWDRTKGKAEVFTPSWLCNEQNNRVDEAWFGRENVFNVPGERSWTAQLEAIEFASRGQRTWKRYLDERRLEVACGEGPYLASRYDATSGEPIALERRVGLLDRKLRVVTENTNSPNEWRTWARRAVESVYGFEYQGDSVLLARENLFATYEDNAVAALGSEPTASELQGIGTVISWNIWQMDLFTGCPPLQTVRPDLGQLDLFGDHSASTTRPCVIRDWRAKKTHEYTKLTKMGS